MSKPAQGSQGASKDERRLRCIKGRHNCKAKFSIREEVTDTGARGLCLMWYLSRRYLLEAVKTRLQRASAQVNPAAEIA